MISRQASTAINDLQAIPGIGPRLAGKLVSLGIHSVSELKDKSPDMLFHKLCDQEGQMIDRCVLYVFRCAVYFATHQQHDPEKLKWWYWKDHS